jgi:integrase
MRTSFPLKIEGCGEIRTDSAQILPESEGRNMKFPKVIKHRRFEAIIYGKSKKYAYYRLAYYAAGKRHTRHFRAYGEAKTEAERIVRELADGSQAAALSAAQSRDALAAFERLESFRQASGRRVSLLAAVSEFAEVSGKLGGRTLGEAVTGYLGTVASVRRKDIGEAVAEFLQADAPRTKADDGQRAQLSAKYAYNRKIQLEKFAATFPNTAVCDLSKEHLDKFIESLGELKTKSRNKRKAASAKSRNHYRASVRQFLQWAVRKDYLPPTHRLFEADKLRPEHANTAEVEFYTPREFAALLETADATMRPIIAIGGLAGLRTAELLRLDWADVWRVPGHIEVTAGKAKTRQRRLVEVCPALAAWLESFRTRKDGRLWTGHEITFQQHFVELCQQAEVSRKTNGLRHAFCTYHFAANANENLTAAQAGNSPAMIHAHYKGLATKAEAEKWFNVRPAKSAKNVIPLAAVSRKQTQ